MVLSIDRKVEVKPGVIAPVTSANIQNCLLLSNKDKFINHEIIEFSSAAEVEKVFGSGSKEENFAKTYFQSYVGSVKRPEKLLIGENYSLQARSASVTSTFFTPDETPQEDLKNIGVDYPQPSVVRSNTMSEDSENYVVRELSRFGTENPTQSYISSQIFKPQDSDPNLEECFQLLNEIGKDGQNLGDFTVIFSHEDDPIDVTANNIDLSEAQDIGDALEKITSAINEVIESNQDLGEEYKVALTVNGNDNIGFYFQITAETAGSQYTISSVSSSVPVAAENLDNICSILGLADNKNPIKQAGMDKMYGDFSITFEVNGQNITATADELDFTAITNLDNQLEYLKEKVNTAITNKQGLGNNYTVNIHKIVVESDFYIEVITDNNGSNYSITNISSTETGNVSIILGLSKDNNASFYPGTDKKYGNFSIVFNVSNEKITATASNLDFTSYSTLEEQLSYLTTKINEAISTNEKLGTNFTVQITKNDLSDGSFNVSLTTVNVGEMYQIDSVFSTLPLDADGAADILKLSSKTTPKPTIINGMSSFPLSNVLDKYANDRSDWWSVSITESSINTYNDISDWVNAKNDGCRYVFIAHDKNELANTTIANPNTFGFSVYQSGKKATTTVFGDERLAGFVAGTAASIDYERTNGTITFSGKRQNGMEITANTDKEANCLESNYYNYYGSYSSTNPKYRFFENGRVSGSDGQNWLDSLFNQIWLLNELQNAMFNLLLDKNKLPFNKNSYALISDCCDAVALKAVDCGVISPGVNLDEQQIVIVNEAVGKDVSENLYSYGYYLYIGDNSSSERQERTAKNCILFYCDGGAIQKIKFIANVLL